LRLFTLGGPLANVSGQPLDLFIVFRACRRCAAGVDRGNNDALNLKGIVLGNILVVVGLNFLLRRVAVLFIEGVPV